MLYENDHSNEETVSYTVYPQNEWYLFCKTQWLKHAIIPCWTCDRWTNMLSFENEYIGLFNKWQVFEVGHASTNKLVILVTAHQLWYTKLFLMSEGRVDGLILTTADETRHHTHFHTIHQSSTLSSSLFQLSLNTPWIEDIWSSPPLSMEIVWLARCQLALWQKPTIWLWTKRVLEVRWTCPSATVHSLCAPWLHPLWMTCSQHYQH